MANSNHKTNNAKKHQHQKHVHHQGHLAQKRFGQNFLHDEMLIHQIIEHIKYDYNAAGNEYQLMEIGPGLGALTTHLINLVTPQALNAIEIDTQLSQRLRNNWPENKLCIHTQDVLQFDFTAHKNTQLNKKLHLVGNLPYNISSPLLLYLLKHIDVIAMQHFMLQKEVVERMIAAPHTKAYGRLSILLQAHYTMQKILDIPPYAFNPPPKVDSAIIRMQPCIKITQPYIQKLEYITRICFAQRRKMLRGFVMCKNIFESFGFDLNRRAEEVSVDEYIQLAKIWPENV